MPFHPLGPVHNARVRYLRTTRRRAATKIQRAFRARRARGARKMRLFKAPRLGGSGLVIPIKVGYQYDVIGTSAAFVNFDSDIGLQNAPAAFLSRYEPIFDYIRINKARIEITCPYNIGQHGVGTQSLYQMWSKKAYSTAEVPPGSITEWLNLQSAQRKIFSGRTNSVNYYITPAYETTVQPLNTAVTQLRLLYKQWQSIKSTPAQMTPHIGIIGQIVRLDGSAIGNTNVFKVNVTLYCQMKGIKQL